MAVDSKLAGSFLAILGIDSIAFTPWAVYNRSMPLMCDRGHPEEGAFLYGSCRDDARL